MNRIKVLDKYFKLYLTNQEIEEAISKVATRLNKDMKGVDTPIMLGVMTGAFMYTASLAQKIDFPCELSFIKLSSYNGVRTTGSVTQVFGLTTSVAGRTVIITEDIVDTGTTMAELTKILKDAGAADVKISALFFKPKACIRKIKVDYPAFEIPNDFVLGFGLDYNQMGRQYKDLYVLDTNQEY